MRVLFIRLLLPSEGLELEIMANLEGAEGCLGVMAVQSPMKTVFQLELSVSIICSRR